MSADPARIEQITQASRTILREDGGVKILSTGARELEVATGRNLEIAADAENLRQFNLLKVARNVYQATVLGQCGTFQPGQTITLKYDRYGLNAGRDFIISGLSEQFGDNLTILKLWG